MAHAIIHALVTEALALLAADDRSGGQGTKQNGKVVFAKVDITSYPTNGETILAAELGLKEIYGAMIVEDELAGAANPHNVHAVTQSGGGSLVIEAHQDDGTSGVPAESANTTNLGECNIIAWGEGALESVENLTV